MQAVVPKDLADGNTGRAEKLYLFLQQQNFASKFCRAHGRCQAATPAADNNDIECTYCGQISRLSLALNHGIGNPPQWFGLGTYYCE